MRYSCFGINLLFGNFCAGHSEYLLPWGRLWEQVFTLFVKILLHVLCKIAFHLPFFITIDKISTYVGV